jgi:streptomycin 6-kinase
VSPLPSDFVRRIVRLHSEAGRAWLGRLPEILAQVQHRWRLRTLSTLEPLHYSFVAFATLEDGTDAIVKAALPGTSQSNEAEALRLFSGNGAVRLLDADSSGVAARATSPARLAESMTTTGERPPPV